MKILLVLLVAIVGYVEFSRVRSLRAELDETKSRMEQVIKERDQAQKIIDSSPEMKRAQFNGGPSKVIPANSPDWLDRQVEESSRRLDNPGAPRPKVKRR